MPVIERDACLQKSPIPNVDELQVPLFESEGKKLQTQVKASSKTAVAPAIESTSVMPRQRPKASSSTPLNLANIPLTLSPSPTTSKNSQSPVIPDSQPYPAKQPAFPVAGNPIFPVVPQNFSPAFQHAPFFAPASSQENAEKHLENLFQSSVYPDPFRDESAASPQRGGSFDAESQVSPVSPSRSFNSSSHGLTKQGLVESASQSKMGTTNTPPASPTLTVQRGHRRNMSDTSAFNK